MRKFLSWIRMIEGLVNAPKEYGSGEYVFSLDRR